MSTFSSAPSEIDTIIVEYVKNNPSRNNQNKTLYDFESVDRSFNVQLVVANDDTQTKTDTVRSKNSSIQNKANTHTPEDRTNSIKPATCEPVIKVMLPQDINKSYASKKSLPKSSTLSEQLSNFSPTALFNASRLDRISGNMFSTPNNLQTKRLSRWQISPIGNARVRNYVSRLDKIIAGTPPKNNDEQQRDFGCIHSPTIDGDAINKTITSSKYMSLASLNDSSISRMHQTRKTDAVDKTMDISQAELSSSSHSSVEIPNINHQTSLQLSQITQKLPKHQRNYPFSLNLLPSDTNNINSTNSEETPACLSSDESENNLTNRLSQPIESVHSDNRIIDNIEINPPLAPHKNNLIPLNTRNCATPPSSSSDESTNNTIDPFIPSTDEIVVQHIKCGDTALDTEKNKPSVIPITTLVQRNENDTCNSESSEKTVCKSQTSANSSCVGLRRSSRVSKPPVKYTNVKKSTKITDKKVRQEKRDDIIINSEPSNSCLISAPPLVQSNKMVVSEGGELKNPNESCSSNACMKLRSRTPALQEPVGVSKVSKKKQIDMNIEPPVSKQKIKSNRNVIQTSKPCEIELRRSGRSPKPRRAYWRPTENILIPVIRDINQLADYYDPSMPVFLMTPKMECTRDLVKLTTELRERSRKWRSINL